MREPVPSPGKIGARRQILPGAIAVGIGERQRQRPASVVPRLSANSPAAALERSD
jgi:hypothetical protein